MLPHNENGYPGNRHGYCVGLLTRAPRIILRAVRARPQCKALPQAERLVLRLPYRLAYQYYMVATLSFRLKEITQSALEPTTNILS